MTTRFSVDIKGPVTLNATLRTVELDIGTILGGVAFGLSPSDGSSIRTTGDVPSSSRVWTNYDTILNHCVANRLNFCLFVGLDTPTWAAWRAVTGGSWGVELFRPPAASWPYWVADAQAALDRADDAYRAAGLIPSTYCAIQMAREVTPGTPGGPYTAADPYTYSPPYDANAEGTWESSSNLASDSTRNLHSQLAYLASNLNKRGWALIAPSMECQPSAVAQERATIVNGTWLSAVDHPAMDFYLDFNRSKTWSVKTAAIEFYDQVLTCRDLNAAAVSAYAGKKWALMETGMTGNNLRLGASLLPNRAYSHARRGDILVEALSRLESSGEFAWINLYCSRERDAATTEFNIYGLTNSTGAYNYAHRAFSKRANPSASWAAPAGGYVAGANETAISGA